MCVVIPRGPLPADDEYLAAIVGELNRYSAAHPRAVVEAYRRGKYLVRVRVTDPGFAGRTREDRYDAVWEYLRHLDEDVLGDIHMIICVTPEERPTSLGSLDFDNPVPEFGDVAPGAMNRGTPAPGLPPLGARTP